MKNALEASRRYREVFLMRKDKDVVNKLIGIPYKDGGMDPATDGGVDCWGLVGLYFSLRQNIKFPSYEKYIEKSSGLDRGPEIFKEFKRVKGQPAAADIVAISSRNDGFINHVGIMIDKHYFLHTSPQSGGVIMSRKSAADYKRIIKGFYRWQP